MISSLLNKRLVDIYVVGFVVLDNEKIKDCFIDFNYLYLEFDNIIIKFETCIFNKLLYLSIKKVNHIEYNQNIDDDIIKIKSSIKEIILLDCLSDKNIVKDIIFNGIICDNKNKCENIEVKCESVEIILYNEQIIFLDPNYLHGIAIGGLERKGYYYYCKE